GRGSLMASAVVLAAGSWAGGIEIEGGAGHRPGRPGRGQPLSIARRGPPPRGGTGGPRRSLVARAHGAGRGGATGGEGGSDARTTVAGVRDLLDAASDLLPRAWMAGFNGARAGLRPATPDGLPIIGASRAVPNLMYATGHYRNGVLLAPLTAQLVADALLDG